MAQKVIRKLFHEYIPAHFQDPIGLAMRTVASRDSAAYSALGTTGLGLMCAPIDLALKPFEARLYERASEPQLPAVFVVGPPRSGTTVVAQTLIANLKVAYFNNLTAVFPRSPITINTMIGRPFRNLDIELKSFYGKSRYLYGPNDALYLWDRWLGKDRSVPCREIPSVVSDNLIRFFGAFETAFELPLIAKNNSLNACAQLIAPLLPNAVFLCLRRDPLFLAQSLLLARKFIHGSFETAYGVDNPEKTPDGAGDCFQDVCGQVAYHEHLERRQLDAIGPDRFWVVDYEDFCRAPSAVVARVATYLGQDADAAIQLEPFSVSRARKLPEADFERLERGLENAKIGAGDSV